MRYTWRVQLLSARITALGRIALVPTEQFKVQARQLLSLGVVGLQATLFGETGDANAIVRSDARIL